MYFLSLGRINESKLLSSLSIIKGKRYSHPWQHVSMLSLLLFFTKPRSVKKKKKHSPKHLGERKTFYDYSFAANTLSCTHAIMFHTAFKYCYEQFGIIWLTL